MKNGPIAIYAENSTDITISNCSFKGFDTAIYFKNVSNSSLFNNKIIQPNYTNQFIDKLVELNIVDNHILNEFIGIFNYNYNSVTDLKIELFKVLSNIPNEQNFKINKFPINTKIFLSRLILTIHYN